jgi:hypothetical protein
MSAKPSSIKASISSSVILSASGTPQVYLSRDRGGLASAASRTAAFSAVASFTALLMAVSCSPQYLSSAISH